MVPWLYNMELVDPNVHMDTAVGNGDSSGENSAGNAGNFGGGREGWGTAEATEMITNNLFYITVKVINHFYGTKRYYYII